MQTTKTDVVDFAIVGGGPCGLGAAWRAMAHQDAGVDITYKIIESADTLGGSSRSVKTPEGFTFDYGGHILFPHANYPAFGDLVDSLIESWEESPPIRGVFYDRQLIPYPVQQNIHRLSLSKLTTAFAGLSAVKIGNLVRPRTRALPEPNLANHLRSRFGRGLSRLVMEPINEKMWATPATAMASGWTSHRSGSKVANVADVSLTKLAASIISRKDRPGWDPSTGIRYPRNGGTGALWNSFAKRLSAKCIQTGVRVEAIDPQARQLQLSSGDTLRYRKLISTMPLDELMRMVGLSTPDAPRLHYASASFVGLGITGPKPAWLEGVHSFHLPDPEIACWRLSFPASLSVGNVPDAHSWSILCEISHNDGEKYNLSEASAGLEFSLRRLGIVPKTSVVVSRWCETMKHGYPVPFLGRDKLLKVVHRQLASMGIYSRGRFGGWKYEVSNMDHTFMQGAEVLDFILNGTSELTYSAFSEALQ